jgi:hypothetical protein
VLIGNHKEAFIEDRFLKGINIISSDDNNKGKTLVIQSMMFALGNDPIFPSSFNYKDYYHIVEFETNDNNLVLMCRKGNSFTVLYKGSIFVFDNLSETKHFINKNIFNLPVIFKDGVKKLVDPVLFYQMFFVGQDNKDTSNIFLHGYYNKEDFFNMLCSYHGIKNSFHEGVDADDIKNRIKLLKSEKTEIQKQNKILTKAFPAVGIASMINDRARFEEKLSKINNLKAIIVGLNSERNNATSRKIKNEITLKELRSLNRSLSVGKLKCLDCESTKIGFSTAEDSYTFDISSNQIRNQIISSIEDKIEAYQEDIETITKEINKHQGELQELLSEDDVSIESLLMYKSDLVQSIDADAKLISIDDEIKKHNNELENNQSYSDEIKKQRDCLREKIIYKMNEFYKKMDPEGTIQFEGLFSKRQSVYSGVEATEFYLSKLYSLLSVMQHEFPIIVDYFRDGELSSSKESKALELLGEFSNQVILTVTLKKQEEGKYNASDINHVNYMEHKPYKLLTHDYVDKFLEEIKRFSINII